MENTIVIITVIIVYRATATDLRTGINDACDVVAAVRVTVSCACDGRGVPAVYAVFRFSETERTDAARRRQQLT